MRDKLRDYLYSYYLIGRKAFYQKKFNKTYIIDYYWRAPIQSAFIVFTVFYYKMHVEYPPFSVSLYKWFILIYLLCDGVYLYKHLEIRDGKLDGANFSYGHIFSGFVLVFINALLFLFLIGELK